MKGTSLMLTVSLASVLAVSLFSSVTNDAFAQTDDFDYRCYNIDPIGPNPPNNGNNLITLKDQFFPGGVLHTLGLSEEFCDPANKQPNPTGSPIALFLPAVRCWDINDPEDATMIQVLLRDQFFKAGRIASIGQAIQFCHSVDKAVEDGDQGGNNPGLTWPGSSGSAHIANWKCYFIEDLDAVIPAPNPRFLQDQFTISQIPGFLEDVTIGKATKLCTPALKTHGVFTDLPPCQDLNLMTNECDAVSGSPEEDAGVNRHIKCYELTEQDPADITLDLFDQFLDADNDILTLEEICVNVEKIPLDAGMLIPLNSVAILLAGAQMSAAWILPALVALAGVGYGIEIARKYHKDTK